MTFGFMPSYAKASQAQAAAGASLSLRAILPAETYTDGPPSGAALTPKKTINGIKVPFTSQPAGGFTGIARGTYKNTWLLLTGRGFDSKANSGDLLLRMILVDVGWRKTDGSGDGTVNLGDWITLADPHKLISAGIKNSASSTRLLSNGDYTLAGVGRASDNKTLWTIDSAGNLLHFGNDGILIEAPHPIAGIADGAVQDIGIFPDGQSLLVASNAGGKIVVQAYTLAGAVKGGALSYSLDAATDQTRGWMLINDHQALVIEQDNQQNADAKIKRVYLADLSNAPGGVITKTLLVDLLKIDDPHNIGTDKAFGATANQFGLAPFSYPYQTISGVYPFDSKTLLLVNDNHFPFGTGRDPSKAAPTELIGVSLPNALDVQLKDTQQ
jgi:glycerophosphoryl diester phosphodiesterase